MVNTIVGGCEGKKTDEKQVTIGISLNAVHQNIKAYGENVKS